MLWFYQVSYHTACGIRSVNEYVHNDTSSEDEDWAETRDGASRAYIGAGIKKKGKGYRQFKVETGADCKFDLLIWIFIVFFYVWRLMRIDFLLV